MASTQQILAALTTVQQDAQAAVPVIPNNGNPNGAYNMPSAQGQEPASPAGPDLSWLQPSQQMQGITELLNKRQGTLDRTLELIRSQGTVMPKRSM